MTTRSFDTTTFAEMLEQFKAHIRITSTDMDADLTSKLKAAIISSEHYIAQTIATSTYTRTGIYSSTVALRPPVTSVTSVKVDDVTLSSDMYSLSGCVLTIDGSVTGSELEIVYTAGMSQVPEDIMEAILLRAAAMFNNPVDSVQQMQNASDCLLRPYRTWGLYGE